MALVGSAGQGCITPTPGGNPSRSSQTITILSFNLYHQQQLESGGPPVRLNWILRRERLQALDLYLEEAQPEVVLLQQMMRRTGSVKDSDAEILQANGLKNYESSRVATHQFEAVEEAGHMAVYATGRVEALQAQPVRLAEDLQLAAFRVDVGREPVLVVQLDTNRMQVDSISWSTINSSIVSWQRESGICPERTVLAGALGALPFRILSRLESESSWKDSSEGFCQKTHSCTTATSENDLFLFIYGNRGSARVDRLLTHSTAVSINAGRILDSPLDTPKSLLPDRLSRLWPSTRFGWRAKLRLETCR